MRKKNYFAPKLIEKSFNVLNVLIALFALILIFVTFQLFSSRHFSAEAAAAIGFLFLTCVGFFYFNYRMKKRIQENRLVSKYPFSGAQTKILLFLAILAGLSAVIPVNDGNSLKPYIETVPAALIGIFLLITFIYWKKSGQIRMDQFKKNLLWISIFLIILIVSVFIKH